MKPISFVRDRKSVINGVLAKFHASDPRYVHGAEGSSDVVLLVRPEGQMTYFDVFRIEDALASELNASVKVLTDGGLHESDRILNIAEKV
jgi:predicted nucleotidyltransferase